MTGVVLVVAAISTVAVLSSLSPATSSLPSTSTPSALQQPRLFLHIRSMPLLDIGLEFSLPDSDQHNVFVR
jgi:hypothetical protein